MTIDLAAIRKAAEAATRGPFCYARYDHGGGRMWTEKAGARNLIADFYELNDREYYIACDPATVLKLVAVCEAAMAWAPSDISKDMHEWAATDQALREALRHLE